MCRTQKKSKIQVHLSKKPNISKRVTDAKKKENVQSNYFVCNNYEDVFKKNKIVKRREILIRHHQQLY